MHICMFADYCGTRRNRIELVNTSVYCCTQTICRSMSTSHRRYVVTVSVSLWGLMVT